MIGENGRASDSGRQWPSMRIAPSFATTGATSDTSLVLPTPASPKINTARAPRAEVREPRRAFSSGVRPTSGVDRLVQGVVPGEVSSLAGPTAPVSACELDADSGAMTESAAFGGWLEATGCGVSNAGS